jgi:uncharacterized YigZ family protein
MTAYLVPAGFGEAELVEKHSRFIGRIWPVECEAEAAARLEETRKKHWDASHNVYAFSLREGGITRCSDDGEPGGTAGMPTLSVLRGEDIQNALCVVTRYFGGTLLGAGGLARAYSAAAKRALDKAGVARVTLWKTGSLRCSYAQYERLRRFLEERGSAVENAEFAADVSLTLAVREKDAAALSDALREFSAGSVFVAYDGEFFRGERLR